MKVLTFGCSFTRYFWPTWADLVIKQSELNGFQAGENWGISSIGNTAIFCRIQEAIARGNLQPNDTVFVCWSTPQRNDLYRYNDGLKHDCWSYGLSREKADSEFDFDNLKTNIIRDLSMIKSVQAELASMHVTQIHFSWQPYTQFKSAVSRRDWEHITKIANTIGIQYDIPWDIEMRNWRLANSNKPAGMAEDFHLSPTENLKFLNDQLLGKLNWLSSLSPDIVEFANNSERNYKHTGKKVIIPAWII